MKQLIALIIFTQLQMLGLAQWHGKPYCVWEDQNTGQYYLSRHDASTGTLNPIGEIPGLDYFVLGNTSAISSELDQYHFMGHDGSNKRLYTMRASSGVLMANHIINDNIVGIESNCADTSLYALREINDSYDLVEIEALSGTVTSIGPIPNVDGYVAETFLLAQGHGLYTFVVFDGGAYYLRSYSIADASLIYDHPFPDNLTGLEYNCQDTAIYALWEDGPDYKLEKISMYNGLHSTVAVLSGVSPGFITSSSSMEQDGYYTYRGFDSNNATTLFTIHAQTGTIVYNSPTTDNASGFQETMCCFGSPSVGVEAHSIEERFEVYPNPTIGLLNFSTNLYLKSVELFSLSGKRCESLALTNEAMYQGLDLKALANGTYILKVMTKNGLIVQRSVVVSK